MNANMKRLLIFALVPVTVWGIGSTFTKQKIDRIGVNTESQITMEDTTRFNSGTASTVPYLDTSKDLVSSSVTPTELGFLSGVSSSIQTQINGKQDPVSGTANEIDFASDIIGLADNPILPGLEGVTIPSGATGDRPVSPNTGQFRWNTDNAEAEIYDGTQWGSVGGGAGGSRLNLLDDPSFEKGVANGSCTGCTASQDTTDYLATPNNEASLKMAFSAASGNYTWTESTSAQYSNVAGTVSAWIKTSASDCHFDELVDGTQSQTVAIGSSDEWKQYIINGTTGTTSYGWRVRCDTSITDDVFVDETFAGAAEPDTFDIGTASLWGSGKWEYTAAVCNWAVSSSTFASPAADADCDTPELKGNYTQVASTNIPALKFSYLKAGSYKIIAKTARMYKNTSVTTNCGVRFFDGTNASSPMQYGTSGATETQNPVVIGQFDYTTDQNDITFELQFLANSGGNCGIYLSDSANYNGMEISVYHYPSPQKVVAAKCDGLECVNEFSARITNTAGTVAVASESVAGWVDSAAEGAPARVVVNYAGLGLGTAPTVLATAEVGTGAIMAVVESVSTTQAVIRTEDDADADTRSNFHIKVIRQGSDYKQFDQRMVRVIQEEDGDNWTSYTPTMVGFGTTSNVTFWWKKDADDMLIRGYFTSGTVTATEARLPLPSGYTIGDVAGSSAPVGEFERGSAWIDSEPVMVATDGETYLTFGISSSTANFSSALNGSDIGTGQNIFINARIPIQGWKKDVNAFIGNLTPKEFVQTPGSTKPVLVSAFLTDGTSIATPSEEDDDFINGNCTGDNSGAYTCTFTTDYWNGTPHCWTQSRGGGSWRVGDIVSSSSSSYSITLRDLTNSLADGNFILFCKGKKN